MTDIYRVYLRHPQQRVSEKTVTPDRDLAMLALRRLVVDHAGEHAAAVLSLNNQQQAYIRLDRDHRLCEMCRFSGPFIDGGETCPNCTHVH